MVCGRFLPGYQCWPTRSNLWRKLSKAIGRCMAGTFTLGFHFNFGKLHLVKLTICLSRYDYEGVESAKADQLMKELEVTITEASFVGTTFKGVLKTFEVKKGENFAYKDPVDSSDSKNQGLIITFTDNSRIIFR